MGRKKNGEDFVIVFLRRSKTAFVAALLLLVAVVFVVQV
jgi:hypothetical protein